MRVFHCLITSAFLVLVGSICSAADKGSSPDIAITLKPPQGDIVLGRPILLTVVFHNNLKRDVRIEGFLPEAGSECSTQVTISCGRGGSTRTERSVKATTEIGVERLSGTVMKEDRDFEFGADVDRDDFLLTAGGSKKQSFDLTKTLEGAMTIDSPGRFRVSLVYKIRADASANFVHDALEWEGESRASPIEINVIQK
jgi:hypothetical protein